MMFDSLKNKLSEKQTLRDANDAMADQIVSLTEEVSSLKQRLADRDMQASTDPWVQITGKGNDPVKGVEISLDWNDAFIEYLKQQKIQGVTPIVAVKKWLAFVNLHIIDELEQQAVGNTSQGTVTDIDMGG